VKIAKLQSLRREFETLQMKESQIVNKFCCGDGKSDEVS